MKKRYFTLFALLLAAAAVPACGGDDDDDDNNNNGGSGGVSGSGGNGNGNAGNGNGNAGNGNGNAGNGNAGNGNGGSGGKNGGNQVVPDEGELTFTGGSVADIRGVFPFGVAVAPNGAIFVSSLGDRNANNGNGDEPARIYRFNPGQSSNPEVLFEAAKSEVGIYGLTFMNGNLYACISQHVLSNVAVTPSIYEISGAQLDDEDLDAGDVTKFDLNGAVVANNNGTFSEGNNSLAIDRCGQIANDGTAIYAPDVLNTGRIYRLNPAKDTDTAADKDVGENYTNNELADLRGTIWLQDNALVVGGAQFGTTAITASSDGFLKLFLANNNNTIFNVGLKDGGLRPEANNINQEPDTLNAALVQPFGIAADPKDNNRFVASDFAGNKLVVLTRGNNGNLDQTVEIDEGDENTFVQPGAVVIVGDNTAVVVSTQLNELLQEQQNNGEPKVFVRKFLAPGRENTPRR